MVFLFIHLNREEKKRKKNRQKNFKQKKFNGKGTQQKYTNFFGFYFEHVVRGACFYHFVCKLLKILVGHQRYHLDGCVCVAMPHKLREKESNAL